MHALLKFRMIIIKHIIYFCSVPKDLTSTPAVHTVKEKMKDLWKLARLVMFIYIKTNRFSGLKLCQNCREK